MHRDVSNTSFLIGVLKKYMQTKMQSAVVSIYTPARSQCTALYMLVSPGHRISLHFRHTSVGARSVTGLWQVSSSMAPVSIMYFLGSSFSARIWEMKKKLFFSSLNFCQSSFNSLQWWRYHITCSIKTLIIHTAWSVEGWQDNHLKLFSWQLATCTWTPIPSHAALGFHDILLCE